MVLRGESDKAGVIGCEPSLGLEFGSFAGCHCARSWSIDMQFACLVAILCAAPSEEDLNCLKPQAGEPAAATIFYTSLQQQAYAALDRRQSAYDGLKTEDQIK